MTNSANRRTPAARQQVAMIEQFSHADREKSDQRDWQQIRGAAATRSLMRPAR
jgi:hypothetical protein